MSELRRSRMVVPCPSLRVVSETHASRSSLRDAPRMTKALCADRENQLCPMDRSSEWIEYMTVYPCEDIDWRSEHERCGDSSAVARIERALENYSEMETASDSSSIGQSAVRDESDTIDSCQDLTDKLE